MSKLPVLSGKELSKILKKIGYNLDHQTGSHLILRREEPPYRRVTVPNHKEISKGTLRSIIRQCGIGLDEFNSII